MGSLRRLLVRARGVAARRCWRTAMVWLPAPLVYEVWHRITPNRHRLQLDTASDVHILEHDGFRLAVYWAEVDEVGSGPSAALYVLDDVEVLRLDCFEADLAHLHVNPAEQELTGRLRGEGARFYFPEGSYQDNFDRAAFEITRNTRAAMRMHPLRRVQKATLDREELSDAAAEMARIMAKMVAERGRGV